MDAEVGFAPFEATSGIWNHYATTTPLRNIGSSAKIWIQKILILSQAYMLISSWNYMAESRGVDPHRFTLQSVFKTAPKAALVDSLFQSFALSPSYRGICKNCLKTISYRLYLYYKTYFIFVKKNFYWSQTWD